jgi:hypothetical protein
MAHGAIAPAHVHIQRANKHMQYGHETSVEKKNKK